jgi:hypothetical protein
MLPARLTSTRGQSQPSASLPAYNSTISNYPFTPPHGPLSRQCAVPDTATPYGIQFCTYTYVCVRVDVCRLTDSDLYLLVPTPRRTRVKMSREIRCSTGNYL